MVPSDVSIVAVGDADNFADCSCAVAIEVFVEELVLLADSDELFEEYEDVVVFSLLIAYHTPVPPRMRTMMTIKTAFIRESYLCLSVV